MSPQELKTKQDNGEAVVLLDVRDREEYGIANLGGVLIPLNELPTRWQELNPEEETVVICHHGMRSQQAAAFLRHQGFSKVRNLTGGIDRWSLEIDPTLRRY